MSELSLIKFFPKFFIGSFEENDFRSKNDFRNKYTFPDWYKFLNCFLTRQPTEPRDRTGNLTSPYKIDSKYTSPIPEDLSNTKSISACMESKALEIEKSAGDKYIDIFLTGGFDSTVMYAAFLKVCDKSKLRAVFQYSEDSEYHQTLNQNNPELYKYIIDNKYTYRLLDLSSTIHTDDSISVLGHPGNFVSNKKFLMVKGHTGRNESLTSVEDDVFDGKYDGESWEKVITAIADKIDDCDTSKAIEELTPVFNSCPVDIKDPYKTLWWFNFVFSYSDRIFGPWYLMKDLSLERADEIIPFFDSEDFQKYMMNVCLTEKKYISPSKDKVSRNDDMEKYMSDFYKNDKIVDDSLSTGLGLPSELMTEEKKKLLEARLKMSNEQRNRCTLHYYQDKGIMRLNTGEVLDGNEYMERESELKEIFFK